MNVDAKKISWLTCYIHDCVYHWCQYSIDSKKSIRVVDREQCHMDRELIIKSSEVKDVFETMYWDKVKCVSRKEKICERYSWFKENSTQIEHIKSSFWWMDYIS